MKNSSFSRISLLAFSLISLTNYSAVAANNDIPEKTKIKSDKKLSISELELAYQKEFIFLKAQKQILLERLERQKKLQADATANIKNQIDRLQKAQIKKKLELDNLTKRLETLDSEVRDFNNQKQALETTILQSDQTLASLKVEKENAQTPESLVSGNLLSKLRGNYSSAVSLLEDLSKITTKKGVFFLTNGEKVEGSITNIGQIAAFGDSNNQSGALIPAGEGYYKLWNNEQQEIEILHPKLQGSSALKLYILSSNKNAISERKPKNLSDTLIAGGTIGWVILALGIAAMVAILLRFFHMRKTQSQHRSLETEIAPLLEQSDKKAIEIVSGKRTGASAHLLKIVLQYVDCDKDQFEKAVTQGFIEESQKLEKLSTFITVVAAVAPLLGLLGTVTGMIATFDIITEVGAGDPKMLSGGISEALVTTMFGLIVAIPALLMGNMLSSWAENLKADMEKMVLKVSNKFARI